MTDWNKLKVVELRAELKSRGLPQTGLKPVLVSRLAAAENGDGSESETTVQGDATKLDTASPDNPSPVLSTTDHPAEPSTSQSIPEPLAPATVPADIPPVIEEEFEESRAPQDHFVQPASNKDTSEASLPRVAPEEVLGDLQKRKRRSQSPIPSTQDVAHKRARQGDAEMQEVITTAADSAWVEQHNAVEASEINAEARAVAPADEGVKLEPTIVDTSIEEVRVADVSAPTEAEFPAKAEQDSKVTYEDSPSLPRDSRFRDLFSGQAIEDPSSRDSEMHDVEEERTVSPAIHPATTALYIRDLMRPLNPTQLKSHLATLATPPGQEVDQDIIIEFFLDPIRTHGFVAVKNISAASRIRSALHEQIWPIERNRKPLWVDFIPLDKLEDWIKAEESSKPGGRSIAKKWEVIYTTNETGQVTAHLQEVSGLPGNHDRNPSTSTSYEAPIPSQPLGILGAPLGPRADLAPKQFTDTDALDRLFRHTEATPKLYFKPVDKAVANLRLDRLERSTSKDYDPRANAGEKNRYTFESEEVVDRGVEVFEGIRPPRGFRGPVFSGGRGPRGGFSGGGGGARGGYRGGYGDSNQNSYRGPGRDNYRGGGSRHYGRDERR